eukprot:SAG11_NODE_5859_length_1443_cov_1.469191_1_plen_149_part_00
MHGTRNPAAGGGGIDAARNYERTRQGLDDKTDRTNPTAFAVMAEVYNDKLWQPKNESTLEICKDLDPRVHIEERDADTLQAKMRDIKRMTTAPFRIIFGEPRSGSNSPVQHDIQAICEQECKQGEAALAAYFAEILTVTQFWTSCPRR